MTVVLIEATKRACLLGSLFANRPTIDNDCQVTHSRGIPTTRERLVVAVALAHSGIPRCCAFPQPNRCTPIVDIPDRPHPGVLGSSFPDAQFGVQSTIYYGRVEQLSWRGDIGLVTMLGHVLAHEIGHMRLRSTEHSACGIMKVRWEMDDYRRASMGLMNFTALERETIQKRMALRLLR